MCAQVPRFFSAEALSWSHRVTPSSAFWAPSALCPVGPPVCRGVRQDRESLSRQRWSFTSEGSVQWQEALRQAVQFICLSLRVLYWIHIPQESILCWKSSVMEEVPYSSPHHFSSLSHPSSLSCIISVSFLMKHLWGKPRISHLPRTKTVLRPRAFPLSPASRDPTLPPCSSSSNPSSKAYLREVSSSEEQLPEELVPVDKVKAGQTDQRCSRVSSSLLNWAPSFVV